MCLYLRRRKAPVDETGRKKRTNTMHLWSTTNKDSQGFLATIAYIPTLISPTLSGFHLERRTTQMPLINITPVDGTPEDPPPSASDPKDVAAASAHPPSAQFDVYFSLAIQERLKKIFDDIRSRRSSLSREPFVTRGQFLAFLENIQGEIDVEEFLPVEKERYSCGEFIETWMNRWGWDACRPLKSEDKDLGRPITNYFISSSHNTYLKGNQFTSKSSPEAYKTVLRKGCRCIEIDVWNSDYPLTVQDGTRSPKPDHSRNLSGSSFQNAAASFKGHGHSRNVSTATSLGPHDNVSVRGPNASVESLDSTLRPSSSSKSRLMLPKDEPVVTHGWTLTSLCGFREVCEAIRESAFETNELPIIISLEVHADHEQQEVMVRIMKEEWGEMLIDKSCEGIDPRFRLPKLEELKRKILIKVKKAPNKVGEHISTADFSSIRATDDDGSSSDDERNHAAEATKNAKADICQALGNLAIYTHSEHFKSFETPAAKKPSHIFSISENRILELHTTKAHEMFAHNKNFFMRAFPHGGRVDSSNPDPSQFWRKGVQMVALNWQYLDEGMMLNEGMFADEQGWVLKPVGYRSSDKDTLTEVDAAPQGDLNLVVTVIAGQHIRAFSSSDSDSSRSGRGGRSGKNLRPFVKCELHVEIGAVNGKAADEDDFKLKTGLSKTDHPVWDNGARLKFPKISRVVQELSFVRFKVEDNPLFGSDELLSWACIRLDRLRTGFRFVSLMDVKGRPIQGGKLLVRIDKVVG